MTWATLSPEFQHGGIRAASRMLPTDEGDLDSSQVGILVTIDPLECATRCGGDLPVTGSAIPSVTFWVAGALVLLGLLLLLGTLYLNRLPSRSLLYRQHRTAYDTAAIEVTGKPGTRHGTSASLRFTAVGVT